MRMFKYSQMDKDKQGQNIVRDMYIDLSKVCYVEEIRNIKKIIFCFSGGFQVGIEGDHALSAKTAWKLYRQQYLGLKIGTE